MKVLVTSCTENLGVSWHQTCQSPNEKFQKRKVSLKKPAIQLFQPGAISQVSLLQPVEEFSQTKSGKSKQKQRRPRVRQFDQGGPAHTCPHSRNLYRCFAFAWWKVARAAWWCRYARANYWRNLVRNRNRSNKTEQKRLRKWYGTSIIALQSEWLRLSNINW